MKKIFTFIITIFLLLSCSETRKPMAPDEINNTCSSGVVIVHIKYCHYWQLNNGNRFYFRNDNNCIIYTNVEEDIKRCFVSGTGTGFFISSDGQIATNSHVAYPTISDKDVEEVLLAISKKDENMRKLQVTKESLFNGKLGCHVEIGIGYNNTFIEKESDLIPCVRLKDSKEHDLAIIQLKSKQTPSNCHIFDVDQPTDSDGNPMLDKNGNEMDIDELGIGSDVFLIGYNKGFLIGATKEGLKSQFVSGKISRINDDNQILYTIPTEGGSSGSPVLNEYGDLVAINNAGYIDTKDYNLGIRVKHLRDLFYQK